MQCWASVKKVPESGLYKKPLVPPAWGSEQTEVVFIPKRSDKMNLNVKKASGNSKDPIAEQVQAPGWGGEGESWGGGS